MWRAALAPLAETNGIHARLFSGETPLAFDDAVRGWQEDPAFRMFTVGLLAAMPFTAFRWETPPWMRDNQRRPFEFVVLDCPELDRPADPGAFATHFAAADPSPVRSITNLGGDARLLVPRPLGPTRHYAHLAVFVRGAPEDQQHALWRSVGGSLRTLIGAAPVWLSTAGLGVPWLHVRIDQRPKYYGYAPYRDTGPLVDNDQWPK